MRLPIVVRGVLCGVLLTVAAFAAVVAYGALSNLLDDYHDSPASTYLMIGGIGVVAAVALAWKAIALWRAR